jgi:sulfatase maturation enzyme AslB (radical SAM superfamily)
MTTRVFRVGDRGDQRIAYDPCSGEVRLAPRGLRAGRRWLDQDKVRAWPVTHAQPVAGAAPVSLCWSPLVRCNLSCPHCLDDTSLPELRAAQRSAIGRLIGTSGVLGVDISGGEPLLLRDLPELTEQLAADGCAVSTTTNGWHLARRITELTGRLDAVRVSLDGHDARHHDALRGRGSFDRALDGIRACVAVGVPVQVQTVLMASLTDHAQAIVDLAVGLGATGVTFLQLLPIGEGAQMPRTELLSDGAAIALVAALAVPAELSVRLRTRSSAEGFTVVRADGRVFRNGPGALTIAPAKPLRRAADLRVGEQVSTG